MAGSRPRASVSYRCSACGFATSRWMGFCPRCRAAGLLTEVSAGMAGSQATVPAVPWRDIAPQEPVRLTTGVAELDRVAGGGLVPGSTIVLAGDPGVGKSTLMLQASLKVAERFPVLYVSAEEAPPQVAARAARLGTPGERLLILGTSSLDDVAAAVLEHRPGLVVVDSVQAVTVDGDPPSGSSAQVRAAAARLVELAQRTAVPVVMIGHVTKDGSVAGPKVLEHLVDVVLFFEGEGDHDVRVVRARKNRYGSVHPIGLLQMGPTGVTELAAAAGGRAAPGSVAYPAITGRRPAMVELEALVCASGGGPPRRSARGLSGARLHQLLAVLDRHGGVSCTNHDVYVAVSAGIRVDDPAADLAVCVAVASSVLDRSLPGVVAWGEVSLAGTVRPGRLHAQRLEEAERRGFTPVTADGEQALGSILATTGLARMRAVPTTG